MTWHHSPLHRTQSDDAYMITASTLHKKHLFSSPESLDMLLSIFKEVILHYQLRACAWAFFPNHYHLILLTYPESRSLQSFINHLHSMSSRKLNAMTNNVGRKVWFQYWDTRLNYVMQNPVRHSFTGLFLCTDI